MGKAQEKGGGASVSSGGSFAFWCSGLLEHQVYTEGSAQARGRKSELKGVGSWSDAGEYCGQTGKHPPMG